jgi:hypothetical protein
MAVLIGLVAPIWRNKIATGEFYIRRKFAPYAKTQNPYLIDNRHSIAHGYL